MALGNHALYPFDDEEGRLERHCKLPLHVGVASLERHGQPIGHQVELPVQHLSAGFLVPAQGDCLIFLRSSGPDRLSRNFGAGLVINGECQEGPFEFRCPQYYVRSNSAITDKPGWAIARPSNGAAVINYGNPRPISKIVVMINNFDFEYGNIGIEGQETERRARLRVEASGRIVEFAWRDDRGQLKRLVEAGVLHSTALTTFSFSSWPHATEEELELFAHDVASLCSIVMMQHTQVSVLAFLDGNGRVVKRVIRNPVESNYRPKYILEQMHLGAELPKLFRQSFNEYTRLRRSNLWRRLPSLIAGIEDPPYLEQKLATLMATIELFIRCSLIENGLVSIEEAEAKSLPELIGASRSGLRWNIPKHYTAKERHRILRNAVSHGAELPVDIAKVRYDFDKWLLFLMRRFLIRIGYDGFVASPQQGWSSRSVVDEFSEEHNTFGI